MKIDPIALFSTKIPLSKTKSVLTFGTAIFMSLSPSTIAALSEIDARSLISSKPTATYSYEASSQDIEALRLQLQDKTKELEDYKAKLFRSSHPEDQTRIVALSRRIAEYEKSKQSLHNDIQNLEKELDLTRKQVQSLESSSLALTTLMEGQRASTDTERKQLLTKIQIHEEDKSKERALNTKLQSEIAALNNSIAAQEQLINEIKRQHAQELDDIFQEAAMLKFELADVRKHAQETEQDLAIIHSKDIKAANQRIKTLSAQSKSKVKAFNEAHDDLALLKSLIDDITKDNMRLQSENDLLNEKTANHILKIDQQQQEHQSLVVKVLEKEEELKSLKEQYQRALTEQSRKLDELKEQLAAETTAKNQLHEESQHTIAQHDVEKHILHGHITDSEEALAKSAHEYQTAVGNYVAQIKDLQDRIEHETMAAKQLQESHEKLSLEKDNAHKLALAQSETALETALQQYQTATANFMEEIQQTKADLASEKENNTSLLNDKELLTTRFTAQIGALESMLAEKESLLAEAIAKAQSNMGDSYEQTASLNERLAEAEKARETLQIAYDKLAEEHYATRETLERHFSEKNALVQSQKENEEALSATVSLTQNSIAEHRQEIEALKERLANEETAHRQLQQEYQELTAQHMSKSQAHDELAATHDDMLQKISSYEDEKERLTKMLTDREADLAQVKSDIEPSSNHEHQEQIETLHRQLSQLEQDRLHLLQAHDDLLQKVSSFEIEKDLMAKEYAEKEAALAQVKEEMLSNSNAQNQQQLESLQKQLAQLEQDRLTLLESHDGLMHKVTTYELDKEQMAINIVDKEIALAQSIAAMKSTSNSDERVDAMQQQLSQLEQERLSLMHSNDDLMQKVSAYESEKDQLIQALEHKDQTLSQAKIEAEAAANAQHQQQVASLQERLSKLEDERQSLVNSHDELLQKVSAHESEKDQLIQVLENKDQALSQAKIEAETAANAQHQQHIEALQGQISQIEQDRSALAHSHDELMQKLASYEIEKEQMAIEIVTLAQAVSEKEIAGNPQHQEQLDTLQRQLSHLEQDRLALMNSHDNLMQRISSYESDREHMMRQMADKEESLMQVKNEMSYQQSASLAALQKQLEDQKAENTLLQTQFEAQRMDLLTKLEEQFRDLTTLQNSIQEMAQRHAEGKATNDELNAKLQQMSSSQQNAQKSNQELEALSAKNAELADTLANAQKDAAALKERLAQMELASVGQQQNQYVESDSLKKQIDKDKVAIESLNNDIEKLAAALAEKNKKEQELERAIQSLTMIAQHQDQALADANSTFSMVQDYNHQLETDNANLKNQLNNADIAQREPKKSQDNMEMASPSLPLGIFNLLHRK